MAVPVRFSKSDTESEATASFQGGEWRTLRPSDASGSQVQGPSIW